MIPSSTRSRSHFYAFVAERLPEHVSLMVELQPFFCSGVKGVTWPHMLAAKTLQEQPKETMRFGGLKSSVIG